MIYTIETKGKYSVLFVDFVDENVELKGKTMLLGDMQKAEDYLPFFEKDLRANYPELFPVVANEPVIEDIASEPVVEG